MKYLLDTNICIYVIQEKSLQVLQQFQECSFGEIGVSSITVAELAYGVQKSRYRKKNQAALEQFLLPFEITPFDDQAAMAYGKIRADLEAKGRPIGSLDMLIAAQALSLGTVLVTNNFDEFSRVPGLIVEDWVEN